MFRVISSRKLRRDVSNIFCNKQNINPSTCIDTSSTGIHYYDDFLDPKKEDYFREKKNLQSHIEMMTPEEYYKICANDVFRSSVASLKLSRMADHDSIDYLTRALESGRKFHLPYVNIATKGQEGLHRMMVLANKYGWNEVKFPVLVITYVDGIQETLNEAKRHLQKAVDESIRYKYVISNLPDELVSQIQWELEKLDGENNYTAFLLKEDDESYWISLKEFRAKVIVPVEKMSLTYRDEEDNDDFDIDEALLEMSDDEMLKYFNLK